MKLSKKVMAVLSATALVMAAGIITSCAADEDDPEGAISGSNNSYTVDYDNTNGYSADTSADTKSSTTGVYRAWKRTSLKHLGALTKITLKTGNGAAGKNDGVMGFAWDLQTSAGTEASSDSTAEAFNVVGVRNYEGKLQCYVSRYYNITDKQKNNFGASNTTTSALTSYPAVATEYDVSGGFKDLSGFTTTGSEVSVWVDVAIVPPADASDSDKEKCGTASTRALSEYTSAEPGAWVIAIYSESPKSSTSTLTPAEKFVIPAATSSNIGSCYAATANSTNNIQAINLSSSQKKQAVYANIYKGGHLVGAWNYENTYFLDEVVEE
ncbi:MAG: hypothetical protein K5873_08910 [Treponema sp.]|nr:hypothetical protein [Treponema sp.]